MKGAISVTVSILRAVRVPILINTVYVIEIVMFQTVTRAVRNFEVYAYLIVKNAHC